MSSEVDIDGLPARVVELTGCAGDMYLTHGWVFHSIAPNATSLPRLMRSVAIHASDLKPVDGLTLPQGEGGR